MSFSKSKSKRFADSVSCAPPVGSYDWTKVDKKSSGPVTFDQGSRFIEKEEPTPGPADTQPLLGVNLNLSTASSLSNCSFATPSKPARRNAKLKSSSNTDLSCKELMSQQMHHLQYKVCELEKNLQRTIKEKHEVEKTLKAVRKEKDVLASNLEEVHADGTVSVETLQEKLNLCQDELSRLQKENIELESRKKTLEADLELESQNVMALNNQILNLETQTTESTAQIGELESTVWQLQVLLDQVRSDKRLCEEQMLRLQSELQKSKATLVRMKESQEEGEEMLKDTKKAMVDQRCQYEAAQINIQELEQKLEMTTKEKQSIEDNVFNLERANELLEERISNVTAELVKSRNEKADLEEEMENLENTTTENLRCITLKYEDLESCSHEMKREFAERESLLKSELEVTKGGYESMKEDLETMKRTYHSLHLDYENILSESNDLERKFDEAEQSRRALKEENEAINKAMEAMKLRFEAEGLDRESQLVELQNKLKEKTTEHSGQREEISELKRSIEESEEEKRGLFSKLDQLYDNLQEKEDEINRIRDGFTKTISMKDDSISKVKEELGKRIVETQTKLATVEHNFLRKLELEQTKYAKLLDEHESLCRKSNIDEMNSQMESWRSKYEDLQSKVRPFKDQLEMFEQEKKMLMSENHVKENEIAKLAESYARILGHQNNKQKIHHIIKIKEENLSLKKEVSKLRAQISREKITKKANSPHIGRKSKFDPAKAFQHGGKENQGSNPLSEIKDSDLNTTTAW